ncbi:MAG: 16S rRNA pseudouridine(516) synthase [Oscillospiraceae bacterium]|nr:16S rRNA pseudouridine(516) synthase [Oscillospiraceae bacterium]
MDRIDKLLASTGRWSRREAAELIRGGRVTADGAVVLGQEEKFPSTVQLQVDGEPVLAEKYTYLMLHKPDGLVSATEDPREKTVLSLLPGYLQRIGLFPSGRLDKDTVGLLLLTNDGALAHALLSPKRHVDKTYLVRVEGELDGEDERAFREGVILADGYECLPAGLERLGPGEALVTLREGKYHQIKRMCAARGKRVVFLKRLTFGPLVLDEALSPGQWRPLTGREIEDLRRCQ